MRDEIFKKKKEESLTAVSFLAALNDNLDKDTSFKIALDAFTRYLTNLYKKVLEKTTEGSQERFDKFREFYEEFAEKTPYCEILESTSTILKVKFIRCPFFEVLKDSNLEYLAHAYCLSDPAFTKNVLPGVNFSRKHLISNNEPYCDNTWEFTG